VVIGLASETPATGLASGATASVGLAAAPAAGTRLEVKP
jgi:hypothetical protein